jgi:hypothetical protein
VSSLFDTEYVSVETTGWVRERAQQQRGGWIYGMIGSGKSRAVRAANLGGISIGVMSGPLLGQRFASDLARQLGAEGKSLLAAAKREGFAAALAVAENVINGHPLVVDAAERLLVEPVNLEEPATALWQEDKISLREWLIGRLERSPTFLVSRRRPSDEQPRCLHRAPQRSPIKLRRSSDSFPDWERLAELAQNNPGALAIARALVGLIPTADFNALLEEASGDNADVAGLFQRLGKAFRGSAPGSWQRVLALLDALGELPRDSVEFVLGGRVAGEARAHEPMPAEAIAALHSLHSLQQLELVEERAGRLSVLPALSAHGIRSLTEQESSELLPRIAHHLLAPVNNVQSLEPEHVDRVLLAHSIFVTLGDIGNAERTAVLHVHGLIDLARRTSLNERFSSAWQQYEDVLRMLRASEFSTADQAGQRLLSYVRHYRAWNGSRAGALADATCLEDYEQALQGWRENALWHQRVIQTLVRLGRLVDARRAVEHGYELVEEHPRRDELLRVRPAWTALEAQALQLSLELIEPILDVSPDPFPSVVRGRDAILKRWAQGLDCEELTFRLGGTEAEGRICFLQPTEVRVRRSSSSWIAELPAIPGMEASAEAPSQALETLARNLGDEARRLISTITPDLSEKDIRRKGMLLSYVDVLNSDLGLRHAPDRWIVGRIEERQLIPTMRRLPPVPIPPELMPETTDGLYFVRVPVYRDGFPSGPAEDIKPAGRGFGYSDLVELLAQMQEDVA